jgi:hypothetical protein
MTYAQFDLAAFLSAQSCLDGSASHRLSMMKSITNEATIPAISRTTINWMIVKPLACLIRISFAAVQADRAFRQIGQLRDGERHPQQDNQDTG